MSKYCYIYWRNDLSRSEKNQRFANIHYIAGYQKSIQNYIEMGRIVKSDFPDLNLTYCDIDCGEIRESYSIKGFNMVRVNTYLDEGIYPGYIQINKDHRDKNKDRKPDYYW